MLIFGMRTMSKTLAMITLVCGNCGNPSAHRITQRSRWFTLFFIPLIPLGFTRYSVCTYCGATAKISKEEAQHLIQSSQPAPVTPTPTLPQAAPQPAPYPETPTA